MIHIAQHLGILDVQDIDRATGKMALTGPVYLALDYYDGTSVEAGPWLVLGADYYLSHDGDDWRVEQIIDGQRRPMSEDGDGRLAATRGGVSSLPTLNGDVALDTGRDYRLAGRTIADEAGAWEWTLCPE